MNKTEETFNSAIFCFQHESSTLTQSAITCSKLTIEILEQGEIYSK